MPRPSLTSDFAPLDQEAVRRAVRELASRDRRLSGLAKRDGPPPLWGRRPGFASLTRMILEQQVSLASGAATYRRVMDAAGTVTPAAMRRVGAARLRRVGVTRQKAGYLIDLATMVQEGGLDLRALVDLEDDVVRERLMLLRGIGRWTADVYLLMALKRPDVWPRGDLALAIAWQEETRSTQRLDDDALSRYSARWRPHRSVAARMLWHGYLRRRRGIVA